MGVRDPRRRSPQGNLPTELSSFVGRHRELLEIRRLLAVTHTVTLTVLGTKNSASKGKAVVVDAFVVHG